MRLDRAGFALLLALFTLLHPAGADAQWGVPDGVPVSTASDFQFSPVAAPDGGGGAFLGWIDRRGFPNQIYAQRLDASGVPAWTVNGIPVCTVPGNSHRTPAIIADGQGGAIVGWTSSPVSGDRVFVQRLDASGNRLWGPSGVVVCLKGGYQDYPRLVPDGTGGALIFWRDQRNEFAGDLYAQRVSAAGALLWDSLGVAICVSPADQLKPTVAAGGAGSAIVAWEDFRVGPYFRVYAQRIDSSGVVQWTPNGVAVCPAPGNQNVATIAGDGADGAVLAWEDRRASPSMRIYAQRLSLVGAALWDTNGVALGVPGYALNPRAVSDGAGGAIVAWEDTNGVRAQRVNASGALWSDSSSVRLTNISAFGSDTRITTDGVGGAIVAWRDTRLGTSNTNIYAQRVSAAGVLKWEADGRAVCTAVNIQQNPAIVPRGPGSAIIAWEDFRNNGYDVFAACPDVTGDVSVGWNVPVTGRVGSLRPNPTRARAALDFELTTSQRIAIEVFDLSGRVVRRIVKGQTFAAGAHSVIWDGTRDRGDLAPAGVYGIRVSGTDFTVTRRVALVR
jgi:hypothetical protein